MTNKLKRKLKELRLQAESDMMFHDFDGAVASGRYAALSYFLSGNTPEEAERSLHIFPAHWPQRQGWIEMINQFKIVYEINN